MTDESKPIPMKHMVSPLPSRTESYKMKGKDRIKSSAKIVQFVDDFPSASSMMIPKVLSPSVNWTPKNGCIYCFHTMFSINIYFWTKNIKNIGKLS